MRYYATEGERDYFTGTKPHWKHSHPSYPEPVPFSAGIQRNSDEILADYNPETYVRGWFGIWIFNLTHWIASEKEMCVQALCEIARLRAEVEG